MAFVEGKAIDDCLELLELLELLDLLPDDPERLLAEHSPTSRRPRGLDAAT